MNNEYILWIAVTVYAAHILEEFTYDWKTWVKNISGLSVDWSAFFIINSAVIILGICCAEVGWRLPEFSLIYISLMTINALFFHIAPAIAFKRFSPGLITSLFFFLPVAVWGYFSAYQDGVLSIRALVISITGGIITMLFPVLLLKTKDKGFLRQ